ncbi:hypothetical protein [Clostridium saccharoperbutylacetonicum]|uniref:hypothetical protein n=1 Tax=Clostridium saccharoperbutylacetonicum TaxID=36745 RepID=UPI0039EA9D08
MKKSKLKNVIVSSLIVTSVLALNPIGVSAEWKSDSNGWWNTEGNSWSVGWKNINGKWYYFKANGYMAHDITIDGYYLDPNGVCTISNTQNQTEYSEPATGDMAGWQKLRGHKYENVAEIYFKLENGIQSVQVKDIRNVDENKVVEWVDDNGIKRHNTIGEIYQLFKYSNTYTSDWFSNKFGNLYGDWLLIGSLDADNVVADYLQKTGQIQNKYYVTLTPTTVIKTEERKEKNISTEEIINNIEKYMDKEYKKEKNKTADESNSSDE